ncbi:MAG: RluA family pseudouridine synthase [Syntrophobacter sp.]
MIRQGRNRLVLNKGFEYREQIDNRASGSTILAYLTRRYSHSSAEDWRLRLENGEIFLDDRRVATDAVLKRGQWLCWRRPPWEEPDVPLGFAVLFEDEDLLAAAKPSGLPTMPAGGFLDNTLFTLVRGRYPEATPVHRLGRGTSGIVLFARTARARSRLSMALRNGLVTRTYRALASGIPAHASFSIDVPIGPVPHPRLGTVNAACPGGRHALSRVRVLEHRADSSLVEVTIETGRPHQIRIHLAAAGHPLTGDPLYGAGGGVAARDGLPGDTGYLLHAGSIVFPHPATESGTEIWCSPPPELRSRTDAGSRSR